MQKLLLIPLLAALVFGCAEGPKRKTAPLDEKPTAAGQAMTEKDYEQAIYLFGQLAESSRPPESYRYRYLTAQAMFKAGLLNQANEQLKQLPQDRLPDELRLKVQLLRAEIPLKRYPDLTLTLLESPAVPESRLPDSFELYARYHMLKAKAFARLGEHIKAAREYINRELYLQQPEQIEGNQLAIWQSLSLLDLRSLRQHKIQPPPDALSGWLELVEIAKDYNLEPAETQRRIVSWRQRYSGHPAGEEVLEMLLERSKELAQRPADIAVLLPLSGRYSSVARAIQEGLLAAYYQDANRQSVSLRIYDTGEGADEADKAYRQAVDEGAGFIIGPLSKEAVERLTGRRSLPVPTLALNYVGDSSNDMLYQFTLSPEDEAREVAERAWQQGYTRAGVLLSERPLGDRLYAAFAERWEELGGAIVSNERYAAKSNDFSTPIKKMLNLNDSEFRNRRISKLLAGRVEFIPRRRQDIDFIFMSAAPAQARQIRPQLKFHHAGGLPVLATSHLYDGEVNSNADRDMDGITFCDMPWTLDANSPQQELRHQNAAELKVHSGQLQRLVALGVDAYQLMPLLPMLESRPYEHYRGETGKLSITENRRVQRQLLWAQFTGGVPRLQEERVIVIDGEWQDTN
ncbi:MAG: penicillin-binding protein activator [Pseudomonadota bacterium]